MLTEQHPYWGKLRRRCVRASGKDMSDRAGAETETRYAGINRIVGEILH
jgi:hypothetical protein